MGIDVTTDIRSIYFLYVGSNNKYGLYFTLKLILIIMKKFLLLDMIEMK